MPQHAADECSELVKQIVGLKERVVKAKRLLTLEEMQMELAALQMELFSLQQKAVEVKTFVGVAFVTTGTREYSDVVVPRVVGMFPAGAGGRQKDG